MPPDPFLPYVSRVPLSWDDGEGPAAHWLEGTVLFVDVAGFTALSERLAALGKAGAEELTDLLDGAFARLLSAAYEEGGSLLSFGGDALLLFFAGPDHERRGAHAGAVMRRKPAELGALSTSVGPVRLKLSMGAHSGRFLFLVTGEDSRVVMLLGPDATRVVRLEQRATAGQLCASPELARAVPDAFGPEDGGAHLLLRTPKAPLVGDPAPPGPPLTAPGRFLAPALREHIAGQPASEHRRVSVGFVQVRGTDALLAASPERLFDDLNALVVATQRACADYGVTLLGSDVDADGAKLILVAGAPRATEHEEERLLRTCRAVLDVETALQVRSGVTAGHVFVGDVGPAYRRAYTVMGDRVNLAARLMASAAPGELRTLPSVLEASTTQFAVRELEPLLLKGIKAPVTAVSVGRPVGQAQLTETTQLLGRDEALAVLREALADARRGCGSAVELEGAAGAGKTALLQELMEEGPALRVAAAPYESSTPLGLVKRVLRHLLGVDAEAPGPAVAQQARARLATLSAADLDLLLMAADAGSGEGIVRDDLLLARLARAALRALQVLVPGSAVLVVEDVQWADPSSLEVLRSVADRLGDTPWLLCTSRRPGPAGLPRARQLPVPPLDEEASAELVHALTADAPVSPTRVAALVARSGGNPLFLTELVRLARDGDVDGEDLPETVEAVVNARLDALPAYLRALVRSGSALGATFDLDLLGLVGGFVPDRTEWRALEGVLVRVGSRASFVSELYRDVAYASLLYKERRQLHRTAAEALQARESPDVELLALHAAQASDDRLTWRYAVEAGHRASARGAHLVAATAFRRAVEAHRRSRLGPAEEELPVWRELGQALVRGGQPLEAVKAYRQARELSPLGPRSDPDLCHLEALARLAAGRHSSARSWLSAGLAALRPEHDEALRLQLLDTQAAVQLRQGRWRATLATCRQLLALTEGTEHRRAWAHAHDLTHLAMTITGNPQRAAHRTQAVAVYEELGDVQGLAKALNNLGNDAYYEGRWDDAVALYDRARGLDEADANDVGAAISDANIAEMLLDQGHYDEAHRRLERALRTFRADEFPIGIAECCFHLGRLEARRGRYADATSHLDLARRTVAEMGADSLVPDVLVREAELQLYAGDARAAALTLEELGRRDVRLELQLIALRLRAALAQRRGADEEAETLLREAVARNDGSVPLSAALARHSLAIVLAARSDPESDTHLHAALDTLRRLGVQQFRDPLAGEELVVIALPQQLVDLTQRQGERVAAAV